MRKGGSRRLERATLVCGLVFVATAFAFSFLEPRLLPLLPDDPVGFLERLGLVEERGGAVLLLLGLGLFVLCLFDAARFSTLRARRPLLRLASILVLVAMAGLAGSLFEPPAPDSAAAGDGAALLAARLALDPFRWLMRGFMLLQLVLVVAAHRAPAPPPPSPDTEGRYPSPWIPPLFGNTPPLPERQWRVLGLMVAAGLFNAYDHQIFSLALKQIQEGLGIDEGRLGYLGSLVRLGVIPGVLLVLLGDVLGRRRLLLLSILGYTVTTGATAFAPNEQIFVACQFLSRTFGAAEATLAGVVVAEEIDPDQRGWALGVLGGLSFLGYALAWVLFAAVETLPFGWRALYLVGLGPLLLIAWLRRRLPETERFERQRIQRPSAGFLRDALRPVLALVRMYPERFAAVAAVAFFMSFSGSAAGFFFPKFMQDVHGIRPAQLTLLAAGVGVAGLCAMPLLGRLGDRRGRKPVVMVFIALNPLAVIAVYTGVGLAFVILAFLAMTLTDIGSDHNLGVFARELFPTSHRATAGAAVGIVGQLGGSLALATESVLYGSLGSHAQAISLMALAGLVVPFLVAFGYPETSGKVLEEIAPERDGT